MATSTVEGISAARAHATGPAASAVAALTASLRAQLRASAPTLVLYFASSRYDPKEVAEPLNSAFPESVVVGCSTAGEFTDQAISTEGISAIAMPSELVSLTWAVLGELDPDPAAGTRAALDQLERQLGRPLRSLDSARTVGFVLMDGVHAVEETVNAELGNAAPLIDFVGGSAADDLAFERTWVALGTDVSWNGLVLAVCDVPVPFQVVKSCSFQPTGTLLRVTKADPVTRTVYEFDGRRAVDAYADAVGVAAGEVTTDVLFAHPLGLMIDGYPWIRSPRVVNADGSISFYAQVLHDVDMEIMESTDLVAETGGVMRTAATAVGGAASGAVLFNCVLRRLQIDRDNSGRSFVASLGDVPSAGFQTYGESWMGHVNQTVTGVVFGQPSAKG